MDYFKERNLIIETCLWLQEKELVIGTWGNVSLRLNNNLILVTPSRVEYEEMVPEDLVVVDMAGKKVLKARPKIYIADAAIRNAVLMDDSVLTDPVEMGKIVETAVYKHVAAFYYQYATSVGYFRGGKKGKEIDIVVDYPNTKNILIEVKYREGAPIADDDAIVELCEESSAAIIITKNADDYGVHNTKCGKDLLRIPAFAFLYLLGNAEKHGYRGMEQ